MFRLSLVSASTFPRSCSTPLTSVSRGQERVEVVRHDLSESLPDLGCFDAVVSSFAIHHLEHERKRSLYSEVFELLEPGGVFANFEHLASPTQRLHLAFFAAIGEADRERGPIRPTAGRAHPAAVAARHRVR